MARDMSENSFLSSGVSETGSQAVCRQDTADLLRQPPTASSAIELSAAAVPPASLTFRGLSYTAALAGGARRLILAPCSGHFEPGQLVAIMGPSGSGKTTLLDCLALKKTSSYSGEVLVNGHPRDPALFQRIAAYVGQEECMPAHWKVREALQFNTALKQPPGVTAKKAQAERIGTLLEAFGLTGVAESYIGGPEVRGISGGQRRRLTLARGVAAQASLLFCDEPTSGLSAADAEGCVKALRVIAKRLNVLALVVIHQPRREVAELFDSLLLLTSNPGRVAYQGPMAEAAAYFKECGHPVPANVNAADFFLDVLTPGAELDASDAMVACFAERGAPAVAQLVEDAWQVKGRSAKQMLQAAHEVAVKENAGMAVPRLRLGTYAVPFGQQLRTLLRRKLWLTMRNPAAIGMQVAMPTVMGGVIGAMFQGIGHEDFGIPQVMFVFILLTMLSLQSLPLMQMLIEERVYMQLETSERLYTESAHIITTLLVTVPLSLLGASIQILIIFRLSGLAAVYLFPIFGWTLLLFFMYDALFSCVAAAAPDGQQGMTAATPFLVIFIMFNGVVVTKATAPAFLRWIFEISPTGYAMQAIILQMAKDAGQTGEFVVKTLGYHEGENFKGVCIIGMLTLTLRLLQILFLRYLNKVQR